MASHSSASSGLAPQTYQDPPTVPYLRVVHVATGNVDASPIMDPVTVPQWLRNDLTHWVADSPRAVLVLDFGDFRWEAETLVSTLTSAASVLRGMSDSGVVMVVSTTQPSVAQVARMIAIHLDVPLYTSDSSSAAGVADATPVGKLTETEKETLSILRQMGGRGTANSLAAAASLEITAAGNRLGNLARRGYVNRVSRSRRQGDEYISPAALSEQGR